MMEININRSFINNTGLSENNCLDNVNHEFDNEFNIISHSKYCNDVDFKEMLQEPTSEICILNLNCLNLKPGQISLKYLISSIYKPPSVLVDTLTIFIGELSSYLDDVQKIYMWRY